MNFDFKKIALNIKTSLTDFKKIIWAVGLNAFFIILLLILIDVIFGIFMFYKYIHLPRQEKPSISSSYFQFKDDLYQKSSPNGSNATKK